MTDAGDAAVAAGGVHAAICDADLSDGSGVDLAREVKRAIGCRTAIVSGPPSPTTACRTGSTLGSSSP